MTWNADQRAGYFGWDAQPKGPPQRRHKAVVDIDEALESAWPTLELWRTSQALGVPAFSGGIMDSWPAWAVDGLSICHAEFAAIKAYFQSETQRG